MYVYVIYTYLQINCGKEFNHNETLNFSSKTHKKKKKKKKYVYMITLVFPKPLNYIHRDIYVLNSRSGLNKLLDFQKSI